LISQYHCIETLWACLTIFPQKLDFVTFLIHIQHNIKLTQEWVRTFGVFKNPHGGYPIHLKLNERQASAIISTGANLNELAPVDAPTLAKMLVFEDCIIFSLQGGQSLIVHVSDPAAIGSVVSFYHADSTLWRAVPLDELNPGWVLSTA